MPAKRGRKRRKSAKKDTTKKKATSLTAMAAAYRQLSGKSSIKTGALCSAEILDKATGKYRNCRNKAANGSSFCARHGGKLHVKNSGEKSSQNDFTISQSAVTLDPSAYPIALPPPTVPSTSTASTTPQVSAYPDMYFNDPLPPAYSTMVGKTPQTAEPAGGFAEGFYGYRRKRSTKKSVKKTTHRPATTRGHRKRRVARRYGCSCDGNDSF